jgi:hypothetical protein
MQHRWNCLSYQGNVSNDMIFVTLNQWGIQDDSMLGVLDHLSEQVS